MIVVAFYIVVGGFAGGARAAFLAAAFSILPLACIWFSQAMDDYVGQGWRGAINQPSPGLMVCIAGWLLLLCPVIFEMLNVILGAKA